MTSRNLTTMTLIIAMMGAISARGAELAEIFGDHMVLQRDKPVPVWGTGQPGELVTVDFQSQLQRTTVDESGRWQVTLQSMSACAEPATLTVSASKELQLRDVLVGDVWLASGQSNMFWPLGKISNQRGTWPGVFDGEAEVAAADFSSIRLNCQLDHEFGIGGWRVCEPSAARGFSAVAYFFGRELHQQLDVPIGLIARSFGGTSLQAWTPKQELLRVPFVRTHAARYPQMKSQIQQWTEQFREYRAMMIRETHPRPEKPPPLPEPVELVRRLQAQGNLHRRYIEPIHPFAIRGFIWYQGESQTAYRSLTIAMQDMLIALIEGRRRLWQDDTLPFYFVQLPLYDHPKGRYWHLAREVLRRVHSQVPHTGLVVTYDFSDRRVIHPPEKQQVGRRLALWALAGTYGRDIVPSGPLLDHVSYEPSRAIVSFHHADGLKSSDSKPLRGFELAGSDGRFRAAKATISGCKIVLRSAEIPHPRQVRFFYGSSDPPNLVNASDLPASPFTTEELRR